VNLHSALKNLATGPDGPNKPAELKTGCKVTSVDAEAGTITFEDGTTATGDLVIGADGVSVSTSEAWILPMYGTDVLIFLVPVRHP